MKRLNCFFAVFYLAFLASTALLMASPVLADAGAIASALTVESAIDIAAKVVSASAALAAVLPTPARVNTGIFWARKLLDFLALNVGNAKNR